MPTFDFTAPDGKSYSVQGPEGATPEQAFQILQTQIGTAPAPKPEGPSSSATGVAKSLGTGLAEGVIGLAGIPGDLYHLGLRALGDNLTPESRFGSNAIKKGVEGYTGEFYKPQGTIEETANKVGQFAPAIIGGPESLALRTATRAVAPAVASEAAGKLTEGTAVQPYAELAGALGGAVGASAAAQKIKAMAAARGATSSVPSAEDLLSTAGRQFESVKASDAVIAPTSVQQMAKDIRTELLNDGKHPTLGNQNGVFAAIDRLENMGAAPGGVTPKDMETIRKNLVTAKMDMDGGTRAAAQQATDSFMVKYGSMGQADLVNGSNPFGELKAAIGNYAAGKRSNTVMGKAALGDLNAATAGSGANEDNALRQAIKQLVRPVNNDIVPKAARLGFNEAEIAGLNQVARGTAAGNAARYIGKMAPTGSVSGVLSGGAGYAAAGPMGAVVLPAAGYAAKKIGDLSTKKAVAAVDALIRSRSPLAAHVAAQLPPAVIQQLPPQTRALLTAMIAADPVLSQRQNVSQPNPQ